MPPPTPQGIGQGSKVVILPTSGDLQVLNLTCTLTGSVEICRKDSYTYESPLDPNLLLKMTELEVR
jgi:hypothetical protein